MFFFWLRIFDWHVIVVRELRPCYKHQKFLRMIQYIYDHMHFFL